MSEAQRAVTEELFAQNVNPSGHFTLIVESALVPLQNPIYINAPLSLAGLQRARHLGPCMVYSIPERDWVRPVG